MEHHRLVQLEHVQPAMSQGHRFVRRCPDDRPSLGKLGMSLSVRRGMDQRVDVVPAMGFMRERIRKDVPDVGGAMDRASACDIASMLPNTSHGGLKHLG